MENINALPREAPFKMKNVKSIYYLTTGKYVKLSTYLYTQQIFANYNKLLCTKKGLFMFTDWTEVHLI